MKEKAWIRKFVIYVMKTGFLMSEHRKSCRIMSQLTGDNDVRRIADGSVGYFDTSVCDSSMTDVGCRHHDTLAARIFNYETCEICINRYNFLLSCKVN